MRSVLLALTWLLVFGCAERAAGPGPLARSNKSERSGPTNPDKAFRWRRLAWVDEDGSIPAGALRRALTQKAENAAYWATSGHGGRSTLDPNEWTERGPVNVGGRTRALLVDPDDPNRLLAGSVSGGLWNSLDGGATWTVVDDFLPNLAICCLTRDPANPDLIYAGTGEVFFNGDAIGGLGIYKSWDRGATWALLPSTEGWDNVCRIAISPADSNVVLAAKRYGGLHRSTDAGETWVNVRWAQGSFCAAFHPTDGSRAVAQVIDYDWGVGDWFHAALYSTDGGETWFAASGLSQLWGFGSRIELAYARSNPDYVYASVAVDGGVIYRSTDGGQSYTRRTTNGNTGVNWYANPLWVDPTNASLLATGGYNIFKSTNGGTSLTQISDGYIMTVQPHVDIHNFTNNAGFNGTTDRALYVVNDGGIWKTNNIYTASTSSGWFKREQTYRTTQFYGAAGDGTSGRIVGGTQDNGTLRLNAGSDVANLTFGGDGGFCAIDPNNPLYCYGEYITLQIHRSTDGGQSAAYIYNGISDAGANANFIAPFILDPTNPNRMLAGGASLWRSNNVKAATPTWAAIRPAGSDHISAIAVAPTNANVVWVGQNNGEVHRTNNGTAGNPLWFVVDDNNGTNPLPNRYVTRILIDPADPNTVYLSLGGFSPDNLWRTTNGGTTWTDVTGTGITGLPYAPIRGIARHPQQSNWLYVGTEVGIFESVAGGGTWYSTNHGPANVSVDELVFLHNSNTLLAATHGRGLWTAEIPPPALGDLNCDGEVNFDDIHPFVLALSDPAAYGAAYPFCNVLLADCNGDGVVDFTDINAFVALLGA